MNDNIKLFITGINAKMVAARIRPISLRHFHVGSGHQIEFCTHLPRENFLVLPIVAKTIFANKRFVHKPPEERHLPQLNYRLVSDVHLVHLTMQTKKEKSQQSKNANHVLKTDF